MDTLIFVLIIGSLIALSIYISNEVARKKDEERTFISSYIFPKEITEAISQEYPHLSLSEKEEIIEQMREYFHFQKEYEDYIYMPSLVLSFCFDKFSEMDEYKLFLEQANSSYSQGEIILSDVNATFEQYDNYINRKVAEIWGYCCAKENIDPFFPLSTPSLFTLDERLKIPFGYSYKRDEKLFQKLIPFSTALSLWSLKEEISESNNIDALRKKIIFYFLNSDYCKQYEDYSIVRVFETIKGNQELSKNINEHLVRGLDYLEEKAIRDSKPKEDSGSSCGGCG